MRQAGVKERIRDTPDSTLHTLGTWRRLQAKAPTASRLENGKSRKTIYSYNVNYCSIYFSTSCPCLVDSRLQEQLANPGRSQAKPSLTIVTFG